MSVVFDCLLLDTAFYSDDNLLFLENAFDSKRFRYKQVGKQFIEVGNGPLHGNAKDLSRIFTERYELLLQRTLRHSIFRRSTLKDQNKGRSADDGDCSFRFLSNTQELMGTRTKKCVFGMLCELEEGRISLQDTQGTVQLDLSKVEKQTLGMFTFNCFVLCEGAMNAHNGVFEVESIGFPPYERRRKTIKTFNNLHFLSMDKQQEMLALEQSSEEDTFVFMSNIYLDDNETFSKLIKLFDGYSAVASPPTLFVMMGNFTKKKLGSKDTKLLSSLMDKLCDLLINKYQDSLCKTSDFVLIPGPQDQLIGNVLPQPKLMGALCPKFLYHAEREDLHVNFQSNPFRIRFGTQEIVVFRQDLLQKMRRNCVMVPDLSASEDLSNHLCKTILDQAHLCPLPLQICPIYWNYSHALNLYPAPHLIVLGDSGDDQYQWKYEDSQVVCPGGFTTTGSFVVYSPWNKDIDFSLVR